jgi:hypothetical protein
MLTRPHTLSDRATAVAALCTVYILTLNSPICTGYVLLRLSKEIRLSSTIQRRQQQLGYL